MNTPNVHHLGRLERRVRPVGRETRPRVHGSCSSLFSSGNKKTLPDLPGYDNGGKSAFVGPGLGVRLSASS